MNSEKRNSAAKDPLSNSGFCYARLLRRAAITTLHGALLSAWLCAQLAAAAPPAPMESVLYSFCSMPNCADGGQPFGGLVLDEEGTLYGTTMGNGSPATVFELAPTGALTVLHTFAGSTDGAWPMAGLIRDGKGNLYGTTLYGGVYGAGTVYEVLKTGKTYVEKVLYSFTGGVDGMWPRAGVIRDAEGNLYGTTEYGGAFGAGAVFELTPAGTETVLYSFTGGADGYMPIGGLVRDWEGNLFGTTAFGGPNVASCYSQNDGCGTVFKLTPSGTLTTLYSFAGSPDGFAPLGSLVRDAKGNLYGTTFIGGANNWGTVFEVFKTGKTYQEKVLYSFSNWTDGSDPWAGGLVLDESGNLYGTTTLGGDVEPPCYDNCGNVFEMTPAGEETVLYSFTRQPDGVNPRAGLVWDKQGNLYGTTQYGGANGAGTVFKVAP